MATTKRVKPPIEKAEFHIKKQVESIEASALPSALKEQLASFFVGVSQVLGSVESVADHNNPPSPESIHGQLVALGRSKRSLASIFTPVNTDDPLVLVDPSAAGSLAAPGGVVAGAPSDASLAEVGV